MDTLLISIILCVIIVAVSLIVLNYKMEKRYQEMKDKCISKNKSCFHDNKTTYFRG